MLIGLGAVILVAVVATAGVLSLQACAVNGSWLVRFGACPPPSPAAGRLAALEADRAILRAAISEAEASLAGRQCTALAPDPNTPFDTAAWARGDKAALHGCWSLDSTYQTRDVDSGKIISYPIWTACFDTQGQGREVMYGDDGSTCEGPVTAEILSDGRLAMVEPDNLPCSDGGYVHRREIACTVANTGIAECDTVQPETQGQASVAATRIVAQNP